MKSQRLFLKPRASFNLRERPRSKRVTKLFKPAAIPHHTTPLGIIKAGGTLADVPAEVFIHPYESRPYGRKSD
jgi:hypothetical protein